MKELTFVTGNQKKVLEMGRILGIQLKHQAIELPEIQSLDLEDVVTAKAKAAYEEIGTPVIVEDTSLTFHALGKLPGTFVKFFTEELQYEGMCQLLNSKEDRSATVRACIALYDGDEIQIFNGECTGSISETPREGPGFGFDCIFIPDGYTQTWSQLDNEIKDTMSHRGNAVRAFAEYLKVELKG
ncbi:MAG: non-canonical purine NTP pyrophosphatase (RdgB/HAM1 family) [Acidimicrobiales bacterium]|jgi:non-canonical purine NTP pyrophosphatase (RdgB/HAM1 family)